VRVDNGFGDDTLEGGFTYEPPVVVDVGPRRGSTAGFELTISGERFTEATTVLVVCGGEPVEAELLEAASEELRVAIPPGVGTCDVRVQNVVEGMGGVEPCTSVEVERAFSYFARVLFLGRFSFDLDDTDATRGGSGLDGYLASLLEYEHESALLPPGPAGRVTLDLLRDYQAVVFSKMQGRALEADEVQAFRAYVNGGGGLVLLGQHGIENPDIVDRQDTKDSTDRNAIVAGLGVRFREDLLCDPQSHLLYNGCIPAFPSCVPVGSVSSVAPPGDTDNGVEYAVLLADGAPVHPVIQGVDRVLLPWGQSLVVTSPAEAVLAGSPLSWSDSIDVEFHGRDEFCRDSWFENRLDDGEVRNVVALAVLETGEGRVVALGDQDMFWNQYFRPSFCLEEDGTPVLLRADLLVKNLLDWATGSR
jgi:hypothetical protein